MLTNLFQRRFKLLGLNLLFVTISYDLDVKQFLRVKQCIFHKFVNIHISIQLTLVVRIIRICWQSELLPPEDG